MAGAGDFNGDGKSDNPARNASSGADAIWNGADSGDSLAVGGVADLNWKLAGVGDFNADGKSDILWRNASSGANGLWNGGNSGDSLAVGAVADLNWKVAGVGDFNGDSKDDILWRNASTGYNAIWNGGDNSNGLPMGEVTDLNWQVAGDRRLQRRRQGRRPVAQRQHRLQRHLEWRRQQQRTADGRSHRPQLESSGNRRLQRATARTMSCGAMPAAVRTPSGMVATTAAPCRLAKSPTSTGRSPPRPTPGSPQQAIIRFERDSKPTHIDSSASFITR